MSWKRIKRWWQIKTGRLETPMDGDGPFFVLSVAFHILLIAILARFILPSADDKKVVLRADESVEEIFEDEEIEVSLDLEISELETEDIGAEGEKGELTAEAVAPTVDVVTQDVLDLQVDPTEYGDVFTSGDFVDVSSDSFAPISVKGSVGDSVQAAAGAVDRITQEILLSLEERATTVVWMFDQSASLMRQREEIVERFDRIYGELGLISERGHAAFKDKGESPLLTQVVAYGADFEVLNQPSDDLKNIKSLIQGIETDSSGIENVMSTVIEMVKQRRKDREIDRTTRKPKRNVKIIIVSDEAGDDLQLIETAIQNCNRVQIPIYVIGVPAPFGRPETRVKWVDPDPKFNQDPQWAIVSQGPESVAAERLRLDFTGTFGDLDMIDSGFGPFHLTRLCYETGGIYFAVHPNRNSGKRVTRWQTKSYSAHLQYFFEPEVMRKYKPDYVSDRRYLQELRDNPHRKALVQAAAFTTTGQLESPQLRFAKFDEARFVTEVTRAQRSAALVEPALDRLYEMLRVGENTRDGERSLRWRAGYDLAIGRAIAAKVRAETYNGMLALVKTQKTFEKVEQGQRRNNTWVLRPAESTETGSQHRKLLEKGKMYLQRVVDEHPGTPWAMLAKRELATPIGWAWFESYTEPPKPPEMRQPGNNNPGMMNVPRPRENAMPKPQRKPPRL